MKVFEALIGHQRAADCGAISCQRAADPVTHRRHLHGIMFWSIENTVNVLDDVPLTVDDGNGVCSDNFGECQVGRLQRGLKMRWASLMRHVSMESIVSTRHLDWVRVALQ